MEIYYLIIGLLLFILGFVLGRKKVNPVSSFDNCSLSYAKGLNYLLSNESDKAIQLFVDLIKVDGETVETHLALGKLFRSRGEVDKAIKIHLNILAKPSLDVVQRVQVLLELGQDYLKAGLLDRSENVFKELLELDAKNIPALLHLQNMYIAEKSWLEAIHFSERLKLLKYKDSQHILTHCFCELADISVKTKNYHKAKQYLDIAIEYDDRCIRAYILHLTINIDEERFKPANKVLAKLIQGHVSSIDLYLDQIYILFKKQGRMGEYADYLKKYNPNFSNKVINHALLDFYFKSAEYEQAYELLDNILLAHSDLTIFEIALKATAYEDFGNTRYQALLSYLQRYNLEVSHYSCKQCGYSSNAMQWQCPSCNAWSSMVAK